MKITDVVNNAKIYGLEETMRACKFPMATDLDKIVVDDKRLKALGMTGMGEGHDNAMCGIIVQFDLTLTNKCWVEAERYHFFDIVSSQSTMHRITKFNLDEAYIEYVDPRMIEIMKEKVNAYNKLQEEDKTNPELPKKYLEILYSNPAGFRITAAMTTNYRQLKTIYRQRRTHRLPEWQAFCDWCETLPYSELITGKKEEAAK